MEVDEPVSIEQGSPRTRKRRGSTTHTASGNVGSTQTPAPKRTRRSNKDINATPMIANGNHVQSSDQMDIDSPVKRNAPSAPSAATAADLPASNGLSSSINATTNGTNEVERPTSEASAEADAEGDADADFAGVDAAHDEDEDALQQQAQPTVLTPPPTVTDGCSVGVQSDKVSELGRPETTLLSLSDRHKSDITHAIWNPRAHDPALLAAGGEGVCRIWKIPHSAKHAAVPPVAENESHGTDWVNGQSDGQSDGQRQQHQDHDSREVEARSEQHSSSWQHQRIPWIDLLDMNKGDSVTAMSWSPDGEYLAVAMNRDPTSSSSPPEVQGCVFILTKSGTFVHCLPGSHSWILSLDYDPEGNLLMGMTHSEQNSTTLLAWQTQSGTAFLPQEVPHIAVGMHWTSLVGNFVLCTNNVVGHGLADVSDNTVTVNLHLDTAAEGYEWAKFSYDPVTKLSAVATEDSGALGIVQDNGELHVTRAHSSEITGLTFQPLPNPAMYTTASPRLLATSCAEGLINVWDAARPFHIMYTLNLGASTSALAMAFTPDGFLLAAGSKDRIMVWNAEEGGSLKAVWSKGSDNDWHANEQHSDGDVVMGNGINGEAEMTSRADAPIHSMSWDADGGKLAYAAKETVRPEEISPSTTLITLLLDCNSQFSPLIHHLDSVDMKK